MILVLCPSAPSKRIQHHRLSLSLSRPTFFTYLDASPKHILPVPPSCTLPACLSSWMLCAATAVHANSHWNICLRSFLLYLCRKFILCSQYRRQSMSSSSLMSSALAILLFPPILLLKPLQFLPIIQNIPGCLVFGARP